MFEKTKGLIFGGLLVLAAYGILLIFSPDDEVKEDASNNSTGKSDIKEGKSKKNSVSS